MSVYEKYVGRVFDDRYRIDRLIGIGGMAVVFEAFDLREQCLVAIKLLREEITNDVQSVKRFINESKAVAMMDHPNIVHIYDVVVSDALKYIVMERIDGITLKKYMNAKKALSFKVTVSVAEQVLSALAHAHERGIIHRDIKPQNVMLLRNGKVVVTDFGIAKLPEAENVTMADKAIGTVYYISPEQASGRPVDARSDLYSLGAMMYEMITGSLPFTADSPVSVALKQVSEVPVPPRELLPSVSKGLEQIILCAMEKKPESRFQSAAQMLEYVKKVKEDPFAALRLPGVNTGEESTDLKGEKTSALKVKKFRFFKPTKYREESGRYLPVILGVCFSFLIVVIVAGYYVLDHLFINSELNFFKSQATEEVTVAEYLNTEYSELLHTTLVAEGYQVNVTYEYSNDFPENQIISQKPEAGSVRKKNNFVLELTVSRGKMYEALPNYAMNEYREVKIELLKKGYQVEIEKVENGAVDSGLVIRTEPAAGESVVAGQSVKLYVSTGASVQMTTMPKFVGLSSSEAAKLILENKLQKGKVTYVVSDIYPEDYVISQETPYGTPIPQGYSVNLTVSKGSGSE